MPLLAIFAAAAQVGHRVNAAHFEPDQVAHAEGRRERNIESAVAVQERGCVAVGLETLFVGDEHGHLHAVLARDPNLSGLEVVRLERHLGLLPESALPGLEVVAVDASGHGEAGEAEEGFGVFPFSAEARGAANAGEFQRLFESAVELVDAHFGPGVAQGVADKALTQHADLSERGLRLRDEFFPGGAFGSAGVDGDEATARGLQIGEEPEHRAVIAHEVVAGIEVVQQFDDRRAGLLQILIEETVPCIGALADREQQVVAIVRHARAQSPLGLVLALVHEPVGRLCHPDGVKIDFLKLIHCGQRGSGFRDVVAGIIKARAILGPRNARELHPFEAVGQFLASGHVADANFLPVAAAL